MSQSDFSRVAQAIRFLCARAREQPTLAEVAAQAGVSEFHFQRMFQKWAGISPKRFLQFLTLGEARELLLESRSVLETSLELGLSSPSRLHDLFVSVEHMTPGQFKERAEGLTLLWSVAETPFGPALMAALDGRLCALSFLAGEDPQRPWTNCGSAGRGPGSSRTGRRCSRSWMRWKAGSGATRRGPCPWPSRAPRSSSGSGKRCCASRKAGCWPTATWPGSWPARRGPGRGHRRRPEPVGYLIPCHRVIQASGALGSYHWGTERKRAILALERARHGQAGVA